MEGVDTMNGLPRMNGMPWSNSDTDILVTLFYKDRPIHVIADQLERTSYAIQCKLKSLGLTHNSIPPTTPTPKKETIMNRTVTVKTFIGDKPASSFDVEAILSAIEKEDEFIVRLRKLSTSTAVEKLIAKHKGNLVSLHAVLEEKLTQ